MKRHLLIIAIFLLLGAVVNVAVPQIEKPTGGFAYSNGQGYRR